MFSGRRGFLSFRKQPSAYKGGVQQKTTPASLEFVGRAHPPAVCAPVRVRAGGMSDSDEEILATGKRRVVENEAEHSDADSSDEEAYGEEDAFEEDGFVVDGDDDEDGEEDGGQRCVCKWGI